MDPHGPVEDPQGGNDMESQDDSHAAFKYVQDVAGPEERNTGSETDRENTHDTGHLGRGHTAETMRCRMEQADMSHLGLRLDLVIQEVHRLQVRRDELVEELLQSHKPMLRVVEHLREKLDAARRLLTLVQLDCIAVREDMRPVKRRLFIATRDCIQSQVTLAAQEYEVAQGAVTQEELEAQIPCLIQELSRLQEAHQNQLNALRDVADKPRRPRATSDVSHCRRASLSLQRRLSGSITSLESWFEPRLTALLKRRQAGEEALRKSKALGQELKGRLGPLREEVRRLELQRACHTERMVLMEKEREEDMAQHKVTVATLEDTLRDLGIEYEILRKSKQDVEELKNSLLRELDLLRRCDEPTESTAEEDA